MCRQSWGRYRPEFSDQLSGDTLTFCPRSHWFKFVEGLLNTVVQSPLDQKLQVLPSEPRQLVYNVNNNFLTNQLKVSVRFRHFLEISERAWVDWKPWFSISSISWAWLDDTGKTRFYYSPSDFYPGVPITQEIPWKCLLYCCSLCMFRLSLAYTDFSFLRANGCSWTLFFC